MIRALVFLLFALSAHADNELRGVKVTSCQTTGLCTVLNADVFYHSTLKPNLMAFGQAKLVLTNSNSKTGQDKSFEAGDGYYDMHDQVIVMRQLRHSAHRELIYDLNTGQIVFF